jgi:hypothetical protein
VPPVVLQRTSPATDLKTQQQQQQQSMCVPYMLLLLLPKCAAILCDARVSCVASIVCCKHFKCLAILGLPPIVLQRTSPAADLDTQQQQHK